MRAEPVGGDRLASVSAAARPAGSTSTRRTRCARPRPGRGRPAPRPRSLGVLRGEALGRVAVRVNHVFHASTCGSVSSSIRGLFAPTISRGRRAGGGRSTASSTRWKRPSNVTRSPASRRRTISNASANRETWWSNGRPNASNSATFQPAPTAATTRPPDSSSTAANKRASIPGGWNAVQATSGPSSTRSVIAASHASVVKQSHGPRSGPPSPR